MLYEYYNACIACLMHCLEYIYDILTIIMYGSVFRAMLNVTDFVATYIYIYVCAYINAAELFFSKSVTTKNEKRHCFLVMFSEVVFVFRVLFHFIKHKF
jgi:hypothetical protein